jgi:DNA-binding transcriptional LysR family regulator
LLVSRDIELAIGTFANAAPEITVEKLFDDALVVLAHRSLGLSDQISWAELATYRMVSIVSNSSVGQIVEKTLWSVNRTRMNALVQSHHWLTVIALTKALNGVCVVPDYAASLQDNTLQKIELVDPTVRRPIDVAALSNKSLSAAAQEFKSLLREQFGKMA